MAEAAGRRIGWYLRAMPRVRLPSWMPNPVRRRLATARRQAEGVRIRRTHRGQPLLRFACNICGRRSTWVRSAMVREAPTCVHCGSSVRLREVVAIVGRVVLGTTVAARDWPTRQDLSGIGFSDHDIYAGHLGRATSYHNTWFHVEPCVDVTDLASFGGRTYDFAVCSDVLEHIPAPVDRAFDNLFAILNPGGTLVLNVPMRDGTTVEHYPELIGFLSVEESIGWVLIGTRIDGSDFRATDVVFHGGPGTTAEMRVYGRENVHGHLLRAGFVDVVEHRDEDKRVGIVHEGTPEFIDTAGGRVHGMHAGVWSARRP